MSTSFFRKFRPHAVLLAVVVASAPAGAAEDKFQPLHSEVIGDKAGKILTALMAPLESGEAPDGDWAEMLAPGCSIGALRPGKSSSSWDGAEASVTRHAAGALKAEKGAQALLQQLQSLPKAWGETSGRHVKFKVLRVDLPPAPQPVKTLQLFSFTAQTPSGPAEHNATWEAEWTLSGTSDAPELKLKSLRCLSVEEARAKKGAWFTDCTESLLAPLPFFREQACRSNAWWRSRLQKQFEQFIYGHHGLAVGDVNGDGLDDVYLCAGGGVPNRLILQQPDGTVKDASRELGLDYLDHTRAAVFADLDSDGDQDLIMAISQGVLLLENAGASGFLQKALLPRVTDCFSLAAADYDGNGTVDFYGCGYQSRDSDPSRVAWPIPFYDAKNGGEDFLVRNEGGWKFSNATADVGLDKNNARFTFAAVWTDYDNDGDLDLAVANDFGKNQLFEHRRDAAGKISFTDVAPQRGLAASAFGMSITAGDYNRDGHMDLYVGNMFSSAGNRITNQPEFKAGLPPDIIENFRVLANGNALFFNDGRGHFTDKGMASGVNMGRWTWGTAAADLNCDGREDLLVANGNITGNSKAPDL